jgi:hypothetical protein
MGIVPIPSPQIQPDNTAPDTNNNPRAIVKKVTAPKKTSINNPQPVKIEMREDDARAFVLKKANGLIAKFHDKMSIAPVEVPAGGMQKVLDYIKKHDPEASSAAVKPALDILKKLMTKGNQDQLSSIPSVMGDLMGQLQKVLTQMKKDNAPHNQEEQPPVCPVGTKWDPVQKLCVIDPDQAESDFLTS